jgi:large subunit ribosomal protein L27
MAHKKAGGSTKNGRDSNPQYRGVKKYAGEYVQPGSIIIRQCGSHFNPGRNAGIGRDFTVYSKIEGFVVFARRGEHKRRFIDILPKRIEEKASA